MITTHPAGNPFGISRKTIETYLGIYRSNQPLDAKVAACESAISKPGLLPQDATLLYVVKARLLLHIERLDEEACAGVSQKVIIRATVSGRSDEGIEGPKDRRGSTTALYSAAGRFRLASVNGNGLYDELCRLANSPNEAQLQNIINQLVNPEIL